MALLTAERPPTVAVWDAIAGLLEHGLEASSVRLVVGGRLVAERGNPRAAQSGPHTPGVRRTDEGCELTLVGADTALVLLTPFAGEGLGRFARALSAHLSLWVRASVRVPDAGAVTPADPVAILNTISHEMRTPLNVMLGMTELARDADSKEERDFCYSRVKASGERLGRMVDTALDASRIFAGELELAPEAGRASEAVGSALGALALDVQEGAEPEVELDAARFAQVVEELLRNAERFAGGARAVALGWEEVGEEELLVTLTVDDEGPGVPADDIEHLFAPFVRRQSTDDVGAGLGLTVSRAIARAMGGDVVLQPRESGGLRAVFSARLRRLPEHATHVLAVGADTDRWREVLDAIHERTSRVVHARSAPEAMRKARRGRFDLIFVDAAVGGVAPEQVSRALYNTQRSSCTLVAVGPVQSPEAFHAQIGYEPAEVLALFDRL